MDIESNYKEIKSPNELEKGERYTIDLNPHKDHGNKKSITGKLLGITKNMNGDVNMFGIEDEKTRELHMFNPSTPLYKNIVKNIKKGKATIIGLDSFTTKGLENKINEYLGVN